MSILLPVHDAGPTLSTCLRSLERQTEKYWECVVVDDGSRDASPRILAASARHDPRIRIITTEHQGIVGALEAGLAVCRAPFVARMDADDWMHRDRLAAQLAAFEAGPSIAAMGTHVRLFPRTGLREGRLRYESWLNGIEDPTQVEREAFVECPVAHPTLMVRSEVLRAYGYRSCGWPEDYDLILRMLMGGEPIGVVPRRLLGWRDSPTRLSRTSANYSIERFTACKAAHLAAGFLARTDHYMLWGYGSTGRALRRALLTHDKAPSHIVELHPRRIGQNIHGAPVIHPDALPALPRVPIVASVAGPGPRQQIRDALEAMDFRELEDFVCAA